MSTKPNILVVDNYDSFTYNLVHAIEEIITDTVTVVRNDEIPFDQLDQYDLLVLSPGPGIPDEAGDLKKLITEYGQSHKILGICLGQQAIAEVFGGNLDNLEKVYHGISTAMEVVDDSCILFKGIPHKFEAGRYHSWVVNKESFPAELKIVCQDSQGQIMGLQHKEFPIYALQFHPESILTPLGDQLLKNFIEYA